jgi:methylphosphotriester-DNA--protein-cysteine methyltransferase
MEYRACARCRPESTAFPARVWIVDASVDVLAEETHRVRNMDVDDASPLKISTAKFRPAVLCRCLLSATPVHLLRLSKFDN